MTTTKETKYSFETDLNGPPLEPNSLHQIIQDANGKFPQTDYQRLESTGVLQKTGVVVSNPNNGLIVAAVRHPGWIPKTIHGGGDVEYDNVQGKRHVERSFLVDIPPEVVARHAKTLIYGLEHCESLREFSMFNEGAGGGGSEPEAWMLDPIGSPYNINNGGELQANCVEETIEPIAQPDDFLVARASQITRRKLQYPEAIIVDTSSFPTGGPAEVIIGSQGEIGPYVKAMQHKLWSDYMNAFDPTSRQLMDTLSNSFGYGNWSNMHSELGNMAYLVFSASHLSIGLPHMRIGIEALAIPEIEAIAVADIFNSDLGTLAEMLMLSTPLVYGQSPLINIDGNQLHPRDMRALMRYTLDTTYPAEFIYNPENYRKRITEQIISGASHTMDRAAYRAVITTPDGTTVERPVMHGRVRLRATSHEPKNLSGRVEFTGCSASPSLWDEAARNSLLQIMMIGAYEALSEGMHPSEYFTQQGFPSVAEWKHQKNLITEANLYGFKTPNVTQLINEGLAFVKQMEQKYPALHKQTKLVKLRLLNLRETPAGSLEEYLSYPRGPFCEVVQNEVAKGKTPVDITKAIEQYQLQMAEKILAKQSL